MPIFFQHSFNGDGSLAIWKIEEPEAFFLRKVPLQQQVTHPYKRLQHLAGRYLLPQLYDDFPLSEIQVAETRRPFLYDDKYHFSISHCGNFAAAIASPSHRVGIDIEIVTPTVQRVAAKFLHPEEFTMMKAWSHVPALHLQLLTIMWCAKEAIYKWYGAGGVDFRNHMRYGSTKISMSPNETMKLPFHFLLNTTAELEVEVRLFRQLVVAWVITSPAHLSQ